MTGNVMAPPTLVLALLAVLNAFASVIDGHPQAALASALVALLLLGFAIGAWRRTLRRRMARR